MTGVMRPAPAAGSGCPVTALDPPPYTGGAFAKYPQPVSSASEGAVTAAAISRSAVG